MLFADGSELDAGGKHSEDAERVPPTKSSENPC